MPRLIASSAAVKADPHRFRLSRAGVLNVWQYDQQIFEFADGRLLLRGANGAGKSKTLEMLLPFVLDGDRLKITASGRHHTSLPWLMLDGVDSTSRVGYVWVEFARETSDGEREMYTCGVGIKASKTSNQATAWYFTTPRAIGIDLVLEDEAGPLSRDQCRAVVEPDGHFFDSPRTYKHHVGQSLFGLDPDRYDELLRLLYWLRQPQVGEELEPSRLADNLSMSLPELDQDAIRAMGDTLDQLADLGEKLDRRTRSSEALAEFCAVYSRYTGDVTAARAQAFLDAHREHQRRVREAEGAHREQVRLEAELAAAAQDGAAARQQQAATAARLRELEVSSEARSQAALIQLGQRASQLDDAARRAETGARRDSERANSLRSRAEVDAAAVCAQSRAVGSAGQELAPELSRCALPVSLPLPAALLAPRLADRADAESLAAALAELVASLAAVRPAAGAALAAVKVVEAALAEAVEADRSRDRADRDAALAERQHEVAEGRRLEAQAVADAAGSAYADGLAAWMADPRGTPVALPAQLDRPVVETMRASVRSATAADMAVARDAERAAAVRLEHAERVVSDLHDQRAAVEAEHDPTPPSPPLPRSGRDQAAGAPLWRLTDFAAGVAAGDRAGLEAALQSSGLLDAWLRADGALLDPATYDVVVDVGPPAAGRSLADVLEAARDDGQVPVETVTAVLRRVALVDDAASYDGPAAVGFDGSWRLGVLHGRASKEAPQYVGAGARAAERARRLAAIDALLAEAVELLASAAEAASSLTRRRAELDAWLDDLPSAQPLLTAWTRLDERAAAADDAERLLMERRQAAAQARASAAAARAALERLAGEHDLPTSADALTARREQLRDLLARVDRQEATTAQLSAALVRWHRDLDDTDAAAATAADTAAAADQTRAAATGARAEHHTARERLGADVLAWERSLEATRHQLGVDINAAESAGRRTDGLRGLAGASVEAARAASVRVDEHEDVQAAAAGALAALSEVPGFLAIALHRDPDENESAALDVLRGHGAGGRLPAGIAATVGRLVDAARPDRPADGNAVYAELQRLQAGPAADTEPRVLERAGVLVALAGDDTGEHEIAAVARRLEVRVIADRELLTERERALFEDHLLGDLGERLRQRRQEATELVSGMNRLLEGVSSSQGIRVRLGWDLRDDSPDDVRAAVRLLGKPLGSLLPDERTGLRDALHRLIEASRAEDPELGYTEHLARALDYRRWSTFIVRITRPERPGSWEVLGRRTPLSQGEQKIVCYLPLFAAAAAHFTSVAGALGHAPRFVLLDDAFPKIDVRTHPLLFGLLVDLDLDFVLTSERLWGDHASVPSLAIYEALRSPTERGIAQYRHIWDGQRLQAVGG